MKILVADDEKPLLNFLERGLRAEGHEILAISEIHELVPSARQHTPDIIVLDRMFGENDSLKVVETLKQLPKPPMVLMLTALDDVSERIRGLKYGADDYLCKPFDFDELIARLVALSRRVQSGVQMLNELAAGKLVLKLDERIAQLDGRELALTKLEYELLHYLVDNKDKVLSRERILSRVWHTQSDPQTNIVDVYISRLRKKFEDAPEIVIQTLHGNGYRLQVR